MRSRFRAAWRIVLAAAACAVTGVPAAGQSELVVHVSGTRTYHYPACPTIRGVSDVVALTRAQAEGRGYTPHDACDPAKAPSAPDEGAAARTAGATVHVDGRKHYHRKACKRLEGRDAHVKALRLEQAARTYWPCPACEPPILKKSTGPAVPGTDRRRGG